MPYGTIDGSINIQSVVGSGPPSTTSITQVSAGFGVTIGAQYTGRFLILLGAFGSNSTSGDGGAVQVFRTTGAIPALAASATGTAVAPNPQMISSAANASQNTSIVTIDTPGIGTFVYYVVFNASTGGTFAFGNNPTLTVIEL